MIVTFLLNIDYLKLVTKFIGKVQVKYPEMHKKKYTCNIQTITASKNMTVQQT